eukprot:1157854-Pelagomonas_calceolata.AAC.4
MLSKVLCKRGHERVHHVGFWLENKKKSKEKGGLWWTPTELREVKGATANTLLKKSNVQGMEKGECRIGTVQTDLARRLASRQQKYE